MVIYRMQPSTGKIRSREINITQEALDQWKNGALIQRVAPHLSPSDREFILTGLDDDEWDNLTKEKG